MPDGNKSFDVIVIGLGAMGSSACFQLASRGVRVLGLEQFDIPHNKGSSHGFSRMIRSAYYEHSDYVPLLKRSFQLWRELEKRSGQKLLHLTGGLYMGRPEGEMLAGSMLSARTHGLPHELLDRGTLAKSFPQFSVPDDFVALLEHEAGFLVPERCIAVCVELAMGDGAEIHGNEPVVSWKSDNVGVSVTTPRDTYRADQLVFCGGAWTDRLVRDVGVPLIVTRQVMGWVQPPDPEPFLLGKCPVWAIGNDDGSLYYGFPIIPESPGLKVARHAPGVVTDPDKIIRDALPGDENDFRPALQKYLPSANGPLISIRICMYTNSPDHHFIIDRHPRHPRVTLACGFSGHGFKFASVVGEVLADLATKQKSNLPIDFLRLKRFLWSISSLPMLVLPPRSYYTR